MSVFEIAAFVLSGCSLLMLSVLVTRRWELARRARRRHQTEDRLKQVALALMDSESRPNTPAAVAVPTDLSAAEKEALADVLGRYARTVRGASHERIVEYFAAEGTIERERSTLAGSGPGWRRATAAFRLGDIGSGECVPALLAALRDREPDVRIAAARSLGRLRAAEAAAELVAAAAERRVPDALVRWALLQIGAAAVPELKAPPLERGSARSAPSRPRALATAPRTSAELSRRRSCTSAASCGPPRRPISWIAAARSDTVGEDMELAVRLHRHFRGRGVPYGIEFVADPVCWTEVPEDFGSLSRQRRRWHRGLGQTLWRHRRAVGNRRYGAFGLVALPYFVLFEFLGPVIETLGAALTVLAFAAGDLSGASFVAFLLLAFLVGIVLSIAALALEEFNFHRHQRTRDVVSMVLYSVLENFGYRQINDLWRVLALWDLARRRQGWGAQRRRGIGNLAAPGR